MNYGGIETRPEGTLLTERAAKYLESGPADVVDLIGHICNLPGAPRIVAEHMAQAMFAGRPEFVVDPLGRWTITALPPILDRAAGDSYGDRILARGRPGRKRSRGNGETAAESLEALSGLKWAVVDVETTGGRPPGDRITEIAAVFVEGGEVKEVFETLVNPERPIPPFVSRLTNISWEMVRHAPTFPSIASELVEKLRGSVFVAHNVGFDWKFVSHEVRRVSGVQLFGRRLCTVKLARQLLPQLSRRSLDHVANYYGVEISGRHRAGGDALATARCLLRLLDDAAQRGCHTWGDLDVLLGKRAPKKSRKRKAWPSPVTRDTTA